MRPEELRKAALGIERRLLEEGDPHNGDDWELMQVVRDYLRLTKPEGESLEPQV